MQYTYTAEIDHTIKRRDFSKIMADTAEALQNKLSVGRLAKVDLELLYCPILMHERYRIGYRSKSRFSKEKRLINCNPHLHYERYILGDFRTRRQVYLEGLLSAIPLMGKAKLSELEIQEFKEIVVSLMEQV